MPLLKSPIERDQLPHLPLRPKAPATLPPYPKAHTPLSSAMSKLKYPKLSEELGPAVIHGWLSHCEDTFESWQVMNLDKLIAAHMLIMLAGLKMEDSTAATW